MPAPFVQGPRYRFDFWERVNDLCEKHNGSVSSGYRSKSRNTRVGGSEQSKHLTGWAADIVLDNMATAERDKFVIAAREMGLWVLDEADHIHLQGKAPG